MNWRCRYHPGYWSGLTDVTVFGAQAHLLWDVVKQVFSLQPFWCIIIDYHIIVATLWRCPDSLLFLFRLPWQPSSWVALWESTTTTRRLDRNPINNPLIFLRAPIRVAVIRPFSSSSSEPVGYAASCPALLAPRWGTCRQPSRLPAGAMWPRKLPAGRKRAPSEGGWRGVSVSSCLPASLSSCSLLSLVGIRRFILLFFFFSAHIQVCLSAAFVSTLLVLLVWYGRFYWLLEHLHCTCVGAEQHQMHHSHSRSHSPGCKLVSANNPVDVNGIRNVPVGSSVMCSGVRPGRGTCVSVCHTHRRTAPWSQLCASIATVTCLLVGFICFSGAGQRLKSRMESTFLTSLNLLLCLCGPVHPPPPSHPPPHTQTHTHTTTRQPKCHQDRFRLTSGATSAWCNF